MNEFLTIVQYYQVCLLSITKYYHSIVKYDQGVLFRLTGSLATGNSPALLLNSPIGLSIFSNFFCNLPALLLNLPLGLSSAKSLPSKSPSSKQHHQHHYHHHQHQWFVIIQIVISIGLLSLMIYHHTIIWIYSLGMQRLVTTSTCITSPRSVRFFSF